MVTWGYFGASVWSGTPELWGRVLSIIRNLSPNMIWLVFRLLNLSPESYTNLIILLVSAVRFLKEEKLSKLASCFCWQVKATKSMVFFAVSFDRGVMGFWSILLDPDLPQHLAVPENQDLSCSNKCDSRKLNPWSSNSFRRPDNTWSELFCWHQWAGEEPIHWRHLWGQDRLLESFERLILVEKPQM